MDLHFKKGLEGNQILSGFGVRECFTFYSLFLRVQKWAWPIILALVCFTDSIFYLALNSLEMVTQTAASVENELLSFHVKPSPPRSRTESVQGFSLPYGLHALHFLYSRYSDNHRGLNAI